MENCSNCNYTQSHSHNKKKYNSSHEITLTKEHKGYCNDDSVSEKNNDKHHKHNCKECNPHNNYYSNRPRRRHRHNTTHNFKNTNGLVSDHCFCHKYKLTGHYHSRKCCYQDLNSYYSGIIEDESTKKCVPNKMCKYYNSYY